MLKRIVLLCWLAASAAYAQEWYVGAIGGFAFSPSLTLNGGSMGNATTGFENGGVVGAFGGEDSNKYWGGEVRYLYRFSNLNLAGDGQSVHFGAHSQIVHADMLWHFTPRGSVVRPFIAFGGGVKFLQGTGAESATQPLGNFAALTATRETLAVIDVGAGIKVKVNKSVQLRFEVRDYMSPSPKAVVATAPGVTIGDWTNDILALGAISYTW